MRRRHELPFSAEPAAGGVSFRLWAPRAEAVSLQLEGAIPRVLPMGREAEGWFALTTGLARPGSRYRYIVDGTAFPDPASRRQPEGVHGPSEVEDPEAYEWTDLAWRGRAWEEIVIYELHLGTFSQTGDFAGAVRHLDHLCRLGVTAVELMPIAEFPGARNWGYDGAFPYAPSSRYGSPQGLKALVEACHARGLAVLLDVVYNHFGPEGNYLPAIAPDFFTERHQTPWGAAIDFSGPRSRPVRDFFIHNALYWLEEFHFDGLRFDAVHAIFDDSAPDIIDEIGEAVRRRITDRQIHLVLENDRNEARRLARRGGRIERFSAQWNDDLHHALHVLITGETTGFYGDYASEPAGPSRPRLGRGLCLSGRALAVPRGRAARRTVGRTAGDRLCRLSAEPRPDRQPPVRDTACGTRRRNRRLHAGMAIVLLSPQIPLLFMGEEWASQRPFAFFCDFEPALAEAVREGRRREFAHFPGFRDEAARGRIPDPTARGDLCRLAARLGRAGAAEPCAWLDR